MKKYLKSLFVIVILLETISCARQITCPEFDKDVLTWIPYQTNDIIELYSQKIDSTIVFTVENIEIIHTTHYSTELDCGTCDDQILINNTSEEEGKPIFSIFIGLNKNRINNQNYFIGDTYFTDYNCIYSESVNFLFEDKEYEVVRIFENIESKTTYKKLILAKGIGIIGLVDTNNNVWTLKINTNEESLERKKIEIKNSACG